MISGMNTNTQRQAADLLWAHWQNGEVMGQLPPVCQPSNRAEGYAVQALLETRSASSLFGWKIAATSVAGQRHIVVDGPIAGRLLAERVLPQGCALSLGANRMKVAECEFAFRMGQDLVPQSEPYSLAKVMAAVASLHPAIEIPDSRYVAFEKVGAPALIADSACAHQFMLGPASTANWRSFNLATHAVTVTIESAGQSPVHYHGVGSNVLGDPRFALTWLANELSELGITLQAGQVVTTGTCLTPISVQAGQSLRASFGALGEISISFLS